jgi:glycosyltransferase involved in cell wall biosynthesis
MRIAALMPTYHRRRLAESALACFLAQTHSDKRLLICDDSGELSDQQGDDWKVVAVPRQPSLPAKYNLMAHLATERWNPDAFAVFEDDDVYLPDYLANHVKALTNMTVGWSHCSLVWTDGSGGGCSDGSLRQERTNHVHLHGCLAISREMFEQVGGWPETRRMDFDLQMLARLNAERPPSDPCQFGPSQYYFRWASTGMPHGQAYCSGPDDERWLEKAQAAIDADRGPVIADPPLQPRMDAETAKLF